MNRQRRRRLSWPGAAAVGAAAFLVAGAPAAALSRPPRSGTPPLTTGTPRVVSLTPRIVSLAPRIVSIAPRQTTPDTFTVDSDVLFAFGSSVLSSSAQAVLGSVVDQLDQAGAGTATIVGYTDDIGDPGYNVTLSEQRAASVEAFLQADVHDAGLSYQAQGQGEADPVAPNTNPDGSDDPAGRALNRRVTVSFTAG